MNHILKKIPVILFILMAAFMFKLDAQAEIIYNTTGEKTPSGEDYYAKYWSGNQWRYYRGDSSNYPSCIDISYDVTYCYEEAYKMLDLVNEQRRKAGVPELQLKDELMDVAMKRAAETAVYWSHTRPNGLSSSSISMFVYGENIHAGGGGEYAEASAEGTNDSFVESKGHYKTMIDKRHKYAGFGCVKVEDGYWGQHYWVQIYSIDNLYYEDGYDAKFHIANDKYVGTELVECPLSPNDKPVQWNMMTSGNRKDYTERFTAKVNPQFIDKLVLQGKDEISVGEETPIYIYTKSTFSGYGGPDYRAELMLSQDQYSVDVLTPDICSYNNGKVIGLKKGTGKLRFVLNADPSKKGEVEVHVKDKPVKNGDKITSNGNIYKVTCAESESIKFTSGKKVKLKERTVAFVQCAKNSKKCSIPENVKIQGKSYKVTSISAGAFKNNKKLKSVTVGTNVKSIGKDVFSGCGNLKKITIKSTKLQSVGKNALKGVNKKAVIKVPKSKLSSYKKLFKGKGQKKTVQIKKLP